MDAEQKAKELVDKFFDAIDDYGFSPHGIAKQCALICVDEIIKVLDEISIAESGTTMIDYGQSEFKKIKEKIQFLEINKTL